MDLLLYCSSQNGLTCVICDIASSHVLLFPAVVSSQATQLLVIVSGWYLSWTLWYCRCVSRLFLHPSFQSP